ncbi:hypothetical protein HanPSC8_Chr03g0115091 [Helianthus annuus]|nr:hypothetical protein HanPSC8_Chr03g0115091 [Helianthus annuus]
MMNATTRIKSVIPAINAALPVLLRSFFATKQGSKDYVSKVLRI